MAFYKPPDLQTLNCRLQGSQKIQQININNLNDEVEIAYNRRDGIELFTKSGNVNLSTTETVISSTGNYMTPSAPVSLEILSGDVNDTNGGSGANSILITGLDGNFDEINETVLMNGTSPVALSNDFIRVFSLTVTTVGSYRNPLDTTNAGTITLREAGGGTVWITVPFVNGMGQGRSFNSGYTVPRGKQLYIRKIIFDTASTSKNVIISLKTRPFSNLTNPTTGFIVISYTSGVTGLTELDTGGLTPLNEYSDVVFTARLSSGSNVVTSVYYGGYLLNI